MFNLKPIKKENKNRSKHIHFQDDSFEHKEFEVEKEEITDIAMK